MVEPVLTPSDAELSESRMALLRQQIERAYDIQLPTYDALWRWSVNHLPEFWAQAWEFFGLDRMSAYEEVLADDRMPGARWFTGARVSYPAWLLAQGAPDELAVIATNEADQVRTWTWSQLREESSALATTLRRNGVRERDVVAAYVPNVGEAIVAFLAVASLGSIWTSVGQDYAPGAAVDRFGQLEPVALIAGDGYHWNGTRHDRHSASEELRASLPTVHTAMTIGEPPNPEHWQTYSDAIARPAEVEPVALDFDHPLWVLFSSGTTGVPKGLVHSHGGTLVEALKFLGLHSDLGPGERLFWYTSPSWVMWNTLLGALACGASVVCYDGSPLHPDAGRLWQVAAEQEVTMLGVSPGYLQACANARIEPARTHDLSRLRAVGSTGAPLPAHAYDWVRDHVGRIPLWSLSGGTDVATGFVSGAPLAPVWPGEISTRCLGVAVDAWDESGTPVVGEVGELVITRPMPSMPLGLWGDDDGSRYQEAYFSTYPGIWRQGDWITITERGSVVIHGRSDATLNRGGVRMGSADIYAAVEQHPDVVEALVVGCEQPDGTYWMPMFVHLTDGTELTPDLVADLRARIRNGVSPRHVPDDVLQVEAIPHTRTGKKLEVPIKRLLLGAPMDKVAQPQSVDRPDLLDFYGTVRELRSGSGGPAARPHR